MKTCVIHFGMNKTGSSSIQQSFWNQLDNPNWKYLDLGWANHGASLSTIIPAQPHPRDIALGKTDQVTFEKRKLKHQPQLIKELESDAENLLISAEWLCSRMYQLSELMAFRDLVASHVDKIILVGYIRQPKGYMESAFQEKLKHFNLKSLAFNQHYPQYKKKIETFDQVFGRENVITWKFDPKSFVNGCVVQDFCSRLGIDFPVNLIKRVNESLSREAIAFLYTYLKFLPSLPRHPKSIQSNQLLVARLTTLNGTKMQFSWPSVLRVIEKHHDDITWMENRLGEALKEPRKKIIDPIRSEKDLLTYKPEDLQWLGQQLGSDYESRWHPAMTPQEVAEWIYALRLKLAQEAGIEKI
jgi:hypothetical protein